MAAWDYLGNDRLERHGICLFNDFIPPQRPMSVRELIQQHEKKWWNNGVGASSVATVDASVEGWTK